MTGIRGTRQFENEENIDKPKTVGRVKAAHPTTTVGTVEEARTMETVLANRPEVTKIPSFRSQRKTQVAAYIRVSSTMKTQEDSFENQMAYYERYIDATRFSQVGNMPHTVCCNPSFP